MVSVAEIFAFIDSIAPFDSAMSFDNVGLLVGDMNASVEKAIVTLDVTRDVIQAAAQVGAGLIISHHPVIFSAVKSVTAYGLVYELLRRDISVICAHTNLDMAPGGVNACLAAVLGLVDIEPLNIYRPEKIDMCLPMGLVGTLPDEICGGRGIDARGFAQYVYKKLDCVGARYTSTSGKVKRVAVCGGSGGEFVMDAIGKSVDAFVTGEVKHHELLLAVQNDLSVVDVGHFHSENVVVEPLKSQLQERFPGVVFSAVVSCANMVEYIV